MLVHLLVVQLAFLLTNARRSWQGSKASAKLARQSVVQGTWMLSKSKDMMLVCAPKNTNDTIIHPKQVRGKQSKET